MTNEELARLIIRLSADVLSPEGVAGDEDVLRLLNEHRPEPKPDPKAELYEQIKTTRMSGQSIKFTAGEVAVDASIKMYDQIDLDSRLEEIQIAAWVNSERHGFHGTATDSELMALIASEAFEAFEITREAGPIDEDKRAHYAEELADIVLRAGDVATILEIDLGQAVQFKHRFNLGRPYRHGKVK